MARIMAIDYGNARIGLAVTDVLQIIATPLLTVPKAEIFVFLKAYTAKEEVEKFVIGIPLRHDGTAPTIIVEIEKFAKQLEKNFPNIPIDTVDESFSSSEAAAGLWAVGYTKKVRKQKGILDKVSASLILQRYLDKTR